MFLSVDPVTALEQPGVAFNRYRYANGNPYKFVDPDGRFGTSIERAIERDIVARASGEITEEEYFDRAEARASGAAVGVAVVATAVTGGRAAPLLKLSLRPIARKVVEETKKESKQRSTPGRDGGQSTVTVERNASGEAISRTHTVKRDGEVVHQHQEQLGKHGGERSFPDEWTGTETVNATPKRVDPKINEIK